MFPSLRIGYVVLPPGFVKPFTWATWHADRHTTMLERLALADFLRDGHLDRHVRRMRRLYARRRQTLIDALDRHLPGQATISGESAGVFLLVRFASAAVPACATRRGVLMASTGRFYASNPPPHEFILRFARIDERSMREGIARLA